MICRCADVQMCGFANVRIFKRYQVHGFYLLKPLL